MYRWWIPVVVAAVGLADPAARAQEALVRTPGRAPAWEFAVKPKALSENVQRGLKWLVEKQLENGAWGQGEESRNMGAKRLDKHSVADTCIAALALVRAGHSPKEGEHAKSVLKAVEFVCSEVEASDEQSLFITKTRGTRVQSKLGTYIDTFMASILLAEVKGRMPDEKTEKRLAAALDKVVDKMSRNQREDGSWKNQGWAPTLAQSMASKGLNRAVQNGAAVSAKMRTRAEEYGRRQFDAKSGKFAGTGSAGVELYTSAANLGAMQDSDNTNNDLERKARTVIENSKDPAERKKAETEIKRIEDNRDDLQKAQNAVVARLDDKGFVAGFGSNGGEEFLSHLNIGESLVVKGGDAWQKWDGSMTQNLNRIQNQDGSWTGHHCITGRTFCTSAALLVLMVDRTPVPISEKMKRR